MRWFGSFGTATLLLLAGVGGCSRPAPIEKVIPSASASAGTPGGPRTLTLVRRFPESASYFQLRDSVLVCEDCKLDARRASGSRVLHVIDAAGVKPGPALKDGDFSTVFGSGGSGSGEYRFCEDEGGLAVEVRWTPGDTISLLNGTSLRQAFRPSGSDWTRAVLECRGNGPVETAAALPRVFDDALLHAPYLGGFRDAAPLRIAGASGPLLLLGGQRVQLYDGREWTEKTLSFEVEAAWRLDDGRTLVRSPYAFQLLDREARPEPLHPPDDGARTRRAVYRAGGRPLLALDRGLYALSDPSLRLAAVEPREPEPAPAARSTTRAPGLAKFEAGCRTPFVVLADSPSEWKYREWSHQLKGLGALQDRVTFFEFATGTGSYFGAQTDDEASMRALADALRSRDPKAKPVLGCLDLRSYLPNRYERKWDARVIPINLRAGHLL